MSGSARRIGRRAPAVALARVATLAGGSGIAPEHIAVSAGYGERLGTAFQFGERLALGMAFGPRDRYEIAAYVQHESNADRKLPNDGLTQWGAMLRLPLD